MRLFKGLALGLLTALTACATQPAPRTDTPVSYRVVAYQEIDGWEKDTQSEAWAAWLKSCAAIAKKDPAKPMGADPRFGTYGVWQNECDGARNITDARAFFESRFTPIAVIGSGGLFTGYYEASLEGSLTRQGPYQTPVYARPRDFVTADLGAFLPDMKGKTLKGRVVDQKFVPYPDRAGIEATPPPADILAWVKDPVALFFMHIQGSGRIHLDDGSSLHVGYDEQNGHKYVAIGKVLKERGALTTVTMDTIRAWLAAHPDQAQALMNENPSYIFFRKLDGSDGPVGAQGVPLTPLRSIAIDKSLYPYGMPFFVQTEAPVLNRLMIAQDTGGAIKGAVRADIFWGYGPEAEAQAGPMQSKGRYFILVPNALAAAFQ